MPIQVRTSRNEVQQLPPEARFVELTDAAGAVACVVYEDDGGLIRIIRKGDNMFTRYVNMLRIKPAAHSLEL
jgi:hypothetical protein